MRTFAIVGGFLPLVFAAAVLVPESEIEMKKLTPVLQVDSIEPVLSFWEDRLGFERTMAVPGETGLAFVAFRQGAVEIMYQTRASGGLRWMTLTPLKVCSRGRTSFCHAMRLSMGRRKSLCVSPAATW